MELESIAVDPQGIPVLYSPAEVGSGNESYWHSFLFPEVENAVHPVPQ